MPELNEVLGAFLAGVTHARRTADEEAVAVAEYYKNNPLLEGMSVPRVRLPEVALDIPVVVDEHEPGSAEEAETPAKASDALRASLSTLAEEQQVTLPRGFITAFHADLKGGLEALRPTGGAREAYSRVTETTLARLTSRGGRFPSQPTGFTSAFVRLARLHLRRTAEQIAVVRPAVPPRITVSVLTNEVKERADPNTVTRLKMTLREEGLEWAVVESPDGSTEHKLTPE